jgi:response regulator RpfG family c-di-GMP phosphodiesterase
MPPQGEKSQDESKIMIVDDEEPVRRLLSRLLGSNAVECIPVANAAQARTLLEKRPFDLILCDVEMPGESGIDFIRYSIDRYPDTAVVMVTAMDDAEFAETALDMGAYGYIIKPFKPNEVIIQVSNALRRRRLEIGNRMYRARLESMVSERTSALQKAYDKLKKTTGGIIRAMASVVETRDPYTAGHQCRVAGLAVAIAGELKLPREQIEGLGMASQIHDLGKIAVPAEILSKPGRLTEPEFSMIRTHPKAAHDILKDIEFPWPIADIVFQHHERLDQSGYPQGLSGEQILTEARVLAVADVVEAMVSHRPYRPALSPEMAREEIVKGRGVIYDAAVVDACLRLMDEKRFNLD